VNENKTVKETFYKVYKIYKYTYTMKEKVLTIKTTI